LRGNSTNNRRLPMPVGPRMRSATGFTWRKSYTSQASAPRAASASPSAAKSNPSSRGDISGAGDRVERRATRTGRPPWCDTPCAASRPPGPRAGGAAPRSRCRTARTPRRRGSRSRRSDRPPALRARRPRAAAPRRTPPAPRGAPRRTPACAAPPGPRAATRGTAGAPRGAPRGVRRRRTPDPRPRGGRRGGAAPRRGQVIGCSMASTPPPAPTPTPAADAEKRASFEREALVHLDSLYRVALRLTGNAAEADDLVQETMLKAYRAWHQYEKGTNAKGWLLTILRHAFINEYRRRTRHPETVDLDAIEPFSVFEELQDDDPQGTFFDRIVDDEVLRAIDELPEQFRETVVLSDVAGLSYEEIARVLEVPVGTVKSRLFRARRMLQGKLYDYAVGMGYIKGNAT